MPSVAQTVVIDGIEMPVAVPSTAAELGELVKNCAGERRAIFPVAGRTMLDYGTPPSRAGLAINLGSIDRVIDHPSRDLTITAEAGLTLAKLRDLLATENQELPIDLPRPDSATLGGAISVDASGSR